MTDSSKVIDGPNQAEPTPAPLVPVRRGEWITVMIDDVECPAMFVSDSRLVVYGPGEHGHVHVIDYEEDA